MRGGKLLRPGRESEAGNVPSNGPAWTGNTGAAAVNPGATSRLLMRLLASVYGPLYSYRSPRLNDRFERNLQSSCVKKSKALARKLYEVAPDCNVVCCGKPSRKSAKSYPVSAIGHRCVPGPDVVPAAAYCDVATPVNTKLPSAFLAERKLCKMRRLSPPNRRLWFPPFHRNCSKSE